MVQDETAILQNTPELERLSWPPIARRYCHRTGVLAPATLALWGAALLASAPPSPPLDPYIPHPRVFNIGNEPDDQMSLVRLLLYSNELDIEGLVATTSTWQKTAVYRRIGLTVHEKGNHP